MPEPTSTPSGRRLLGPDSWPYLLSPLIPAAVVVELANVSATVVFFVSALALIPPAAMMGRATEELAERSGNVVGGLLNVTFGNAPELIIALFALGKGLQEVVKASLIGSILGNILLVMGGAMLVGGLSGGRSHDVQKFGRTAANVQSTMLLLAVAALIMPAVFALVEGGGLPQAGAERVDYGSNLEHLSFAVACVLIVSYAGGLLFSLRTHAHVFNPHEEESEIEDRGSGARGVQCSLSPSRARWSACSPRSWSVRSRRPPRRSGCRSSSSARSSSPSSAMRPSIGSPCWSPTRTR